MVRSYYDETSEVARWNIYNGTPNSTDSGLMFVIPNATQIVADYRNGILEISIPKKEEARPKQIAINVNQKQLNA